MIDVYRIDDYFEFPFSTRNCITGVGVDADALPTFRVYEENNETAVASGNTAKRDDGNTTGCYIARAQCTTAAGFEVGKKYYVYVTATVDSVADTAPIGEFRIIPVVAWNSMIGGTDTLEVDTVAISGDTTAADNLEAGYDGTGYAGGTTKQLVEVNTKTGFSLATPPPTTAEIKTAIEAAGSSLAQILADTGELQTDWANGGRLDLLIDAIITHLTDIKGSGWATETLKAIVTAIGTRMATFTYTAPDNTGISTAATAAGQAKTAADAAKTSADSALTAIGDVKDQTDQLVFTTPGKVDASATATVDEVAIAAAVIAGIGTPASQSSVDNLISAITGQEITVISPLIDAGTIQITPGDTYNPDKATRLIRFKNTGSWTDLDGATVTIEWTGTGTATCEVFAHGGVTTEQIIDIPLSAANTLAMLAGPFKIYATWTSPADIETLVIGQVVISGEVD